jgi:hypothetical protein
MRRPPSPRELVAALAACGEGDDDCGQELKQLLAASSSQLADVLGTTQAKLLALPGMAHGARQARVRELLRDARQRQQSASASVAQNLSVAAATMLAKLARWDGARVVLDPRIVLGRSLLADRSRRYVRFDAEDFPAVAVRRDKLAQAARALTFKDMACSIDARGLRFTWRGGRGRLLLTNQEVELRHRDTVLHVVMAKPCPTSLPVRATTPRQERAGSWAPDFFGELSVF